MTLRKLLLTAALPLAFALVGCGPTTTTGGTQTKVSDARGNTVTVDEKLSINSPMGIISAPPTTNGGTAESRRSWASWI